VQNEEIIFDPTITCNTELADCFKVFTDPKRISDKPAERVNPRQTRLRLLKSRIYTDGACINNGKANARCGSGIWFGPNHRENKAIRVPGNLQSNQVGELVAIIAATDATPLNQPLVIVTDSRYAIEGLTTHLGTWEDRGWIGIKNANLFKKAAYLLRRRTARITFKWIKEHTGDQGNECSDQLAKEGANKDVDDPLDLTIPIEYDLQGAKLASLTQKDVYKGICGRKKHRRRKATDRNLQLTRNAIKEYNSEEETDESIWNGLQNPTIRT
jgi:ribonuclease HI